MNAFSPLITHSSVASSSTARVRVPPGVAAGVGLGEAEAARAPGRRTGRAATAGAAPRCRTGRSGWPRARPPASRVMARDWSTRPSSSMATHRVVRSAPPPPYSSGKGMPNRPSSPMARTTSTGKVWSRSHASACGAISRLGEVAHHLAAALPARSGRVSMLMGEDGRRDVRHRRSPRRRRRPPGHRPGRRHLRPRRPRFSRLLGGRAALHRAPGLRPLRRRPSRPPVAGPPVAGPGRSTPGPRASTGPASRPAWSTIRERHRRRRRLPGQPHPPAVGAPLPPGRPTSPPSVRRWPPATPRRSARSCACPPTASRSPRRRPSGSWPVGATGCGPRPSRAPPPPWTTSSPRTGPRT